MQHFRDSFHCFILVIYCFYFALCGLCWNCPEQTHHAAFCGLQFTILNLFVLVKHPPMVYFVFIFVVIWIAEPIMSSFFVQCLTSTAHDRHIWRAASSIDCITKRISDKWCVFLDWQISYSFHPPHTYGCTQLVYKEMMFNIPKLKLCSIDPEYCMLFFCLLSCDWG